MIPFSASRRGLRRSNSSFGKRGILDQLSRMRANNTLVLVQSADRSGSIFNRTGTSPISLAQTAERAEMIFNLTGANTLTVTDAAERQKFAPLTATSTVTLVQEADVVKEGDGIQSTFSIEYQNANDYIDITTTGPTTIYAPNDVPMSISWWEKVKSGSGTYPSRFRLQGTVDSLGFIRSTDANFATFAKFNHTSGVALKWPDAPSLASSVDVWRHWVITMVKPNSGSSSDSQLYVDGVNYTATTSLGGNFGTNDTSRIGFDGGDSPANCLIDDIHVWYNKILTQEEVDGIFANTAVPAHGPGDLYWALEEGSGTNTDEPINGKDGTLTNGPAWSNDVPAALA